MNKVILIGRLTKDPTLEYTSTSIAYCNFVLAVNRPFGNNEADFIGCTAWRKTAENLVKYMRKGSQIAVEGSIQTSSYTAKDGGTKYVTKVNVERIEFLSSNRNESGIDQNLYQAPQKTPQDFMDPPVQEQEPFPNIKSQYNISNDDLPF